MGRITLPGTTATKSGPASVGAAFSAAFSAASTIAAAARSRRLSALCVYGNAVNGTRLPKLTTVAPPSSMVWGSVPRRKIRCASPAANAWADRNRICTLVQSAARLHRVGRGLAVGARPSSNTNSVRPSGASWGGAVVRR